MSTIRPPLTTSMTGPDDHLAVVLLLLDGRPGPLVLGPLLGQDEAPLLVLLLEHEGLDVVAERDDLVGVDVVADGELAGGDDALGLEADVEQDLVAVDLDDGALDDVAVVELDDGVAHRLLEIGVRPGRRRRWCGGCSSPRRRRCPSLRGRGGRCVLVSAMVKLLAAGATCTRRTAPGSVSSDTGCAAAGAGGQGVQRTSCSRGSHPAARRPRPSALGRGPARSRRHGDGRGGP